MGGYRVLERLSAGGFGIVYRAVDPQGGVVAIKEYLPAALARRAPGERKPEVAPDRLTLYRLGLKCFFEEGRALAQIRHAAVVGVHNFFRDNDTVYLVMDHLQGASLQDYLHTARRLGRPKVLRESTIRALFDEVLRGLRIVHQHKMLHLDIKPANLFITDDDRAVLLDFGAAREVLSKQGRLIRPMFTPGFAAPEMYRRDVPLGPWTDIYAIGASLYACMQGCPPPEVPQRRESDRLPQLLERLQGAYSESLVAIVRWCMQLDALARPQSVFALQRALSREPEPRQTPPTLMQRLGGQMKSALAGGRAA